jgi:hypothetical protein
MRPSRICRWLIAVALVLALAPAAAMAKDTPVAAPTEAPKSMTVPPPGFTTDAEQAVRATLRDPKVRELRREHPGATLRPFVYGGWRWQITVLDGKRVIGDVEVSAYGKVMRVWTGVAAGSYLARGRFAPAFDRPWVWMAFGVLFLVPFVDVRRLRRLLHLDLLVLLSCGISYGAMEAGHADAAVLLVYPPLVYLLARLVTVGLRGPRPSGRLVPHLPTAALLVGLVALFSARVALNVTTDRVIDIGYASVVGADRVAHKQPLYENNDFHGDTYGPFNYLTYVPFEAAFPWRGEWDELPAAHAAALFFDLMTIVGLVLLGTKLRAGPEGRRLGLALAWGWAAFPMTLLGLMSNTNDGLVSMLLVFTLLAFRSAPARGAWLGVAAATKFVPAALLLLVARGQGGEGRRAWWQTVATCLGIFVFAMAWYLPDGGVRELWDCTLGFQLHRAPDMSLWTLTPDWLWTQKALEGAMLLLVAVIGLAPGRRSLPQVAALMGATMIALQLPAGHWFYFYIMWFLPLGLCGLFGLHREPAVAAVADAPPDDRDELPAPLALAG